MNYFIKVEDHPDDLDDSNINNIAIITLVGGNNLTLSDTNIIISTNMGNWLETKINDVGTWYIGREITIRELFPDQMSPGFYMIRVLYQGDNVPIAENTVNIDNSKMSLNDFNKIIMLSSLDELNTDMPSEADSSATLYWNLPPDEGYSGISVGVKYYGRIWDVSDTWCYQFRLDAIHAGLERPNMALDIFLDSLKLWNNERIGIRDVTHYNIGGWHTDDEGADNYDDVAAAVCEIAISALPTILSFPITTGVVLADLLSEAPSIQWSCEGSYMNEGYFDNSGFTYINVYVDPNTNWEIKFDVEANYPFGEPSLYLSDGQGRIVYGETSPEEYNTAPNKPSKPDGPTSVELHLWNKWRTSATDPEYDKIEYGWDWNDDNVVDDWYGPVASGTTLVGSYVFSEYGNGYYNIKVKTRDEHGAESDWSPSLTVTIIDKSPPHIYISNPVDDGIYLRNKRIIPFPDICVVIGTITVEVDASDDNGVASVEFYVDGNKKHTDSTKPYTWNWRNDKSFALDRLEAIAYDVAGKSASYDRLVFKIF